MNLNYKPLLDIDIKFYAKFTPNLHKVYSKNIKRFSVSGTIIIFKRKISTNKTRKKIEYRNYRVVPLLKNKKQKNLGILNMPKRNDFCDSFYMLDRKYYD